MGAAPSYLIEADRLATAADQAAVNYGSSSQAVVFLRYEELIRLRYVQTMTTSTRQIDFRAQRVCDALHQAYARPLTTRRDHPTRVIDQNPLVIEFDRDVFDERYAKAAQATSGQIWNVQSGELPDCITSGVPYMFVVDDIGELLIWGRSFSFEELIFGRARSKIDDVPVAHPMLVRDRLRVRAAGEVVFIGAPFVKAIIANTKSGHFRPPPSTGAVIHEAFCLLLQVPTHRIDVFTVGGRSNSEHSNSTQRLEES